MSCCLKTKNVPAIKRNFVSSMKEVTFPTNKMECLKFDYKSLTHKMHGWSEYTILHFIEEYCLLYKHASYWSNPSILEHIRVWQQVTIYVWVAVQHFVWKQCKDTYKYGYRAKFIYRWILTTLTLNHVSILQVNGRSPLCVCRCPIRTYFWPNAFLHTARVKGFSPICILLCVINYPSE